MDWRQIMGIKKENEHLETYEQYPHNPQYSGLADNITDITDITDKSEKVKNMDSEIQYQFEERAAIMEFDGCLSREEAEALAREGGIGSPWPYGVNPAISVVNKKVKIEILNSGGKKWT